VFELRQSVNIETGELTMKRAWIGEIVADAHEVLAAIDDGGPPGRSRRLLTAETVQEVERQVSEIVGGPVEWRRGGHPPKRYEDVEPYDHQRLAELRHAEYERNYDKMVRDFIENDLRITAAREHYSESRHVACGMNVLSVV